MVLLVDALEKRIYAAPLSSYYAGINRERGFVLGFANTREDRMAPAVRDLVEAIGETRPRTHQRKQTNSAAWQRTA